MRCMRRRDRSKTRRRLCLRLQFLRFLKRAFLPTLLRTQGCLTPFQRSAFSTRPSDWRGRGRVLGSRCGRAKGRSCGRGSRSNGGRDIRRSRVRGCPAFLLLARSRATFVVTAFSRSMTMVVRSLWGVRSVRIVRCRWRSMMMRVMGVRLRVAMRVLRVASIGGSVGRGERGWGCMTFLCSTIFITTSLRRSPTMVVVVMVMVTANGFSDDERVLKIRCFKREDIPSSFHLLLPFLSLPFIFFFPIFLLLLPGMMFFRLVRNRLPSYSIVRLTRRQKRIRIGSLQWETRGRSLGRPKPSFFLLFFVFLAVSGKVVGRGGAKWEIEFTEAGVESPRLRPGAKTETRNRKTLGTRKGQWTQ